jgi:hypothetical protein
MVVAKVMERPAVSKQALRRYHIQKFNLKKLSKVEGHEISNRVAALENVDAEMDTSCAWETARETIKML